MQYTSPLNVDLPENVRANTFRQRRVKACEVHALWAARQFANVLVRRQLVNLGVDAIEDAGLEHGIACTMGRYQVEGPLREFAARVCVRLTRQKLAANAARR
jgi:hypothetical protein